MERRTRKCLGLLRIWAAIPTRVVGVGGGASYQHREPPQLGIMIESMGLSKSAASRLVPEPHATPTIPIVPCHTMPYDTIL